MGRTFHKHKTKNRNKTPRQKEGWPSSLFPSLPFSLTPTSLFFGPFPRFSPQFPTKPACQESNANSPGLVDFAIRQVNSAVTTLLDHKVIFFGRIQITEEQWNQSEQQNVFALVETIFGLVNVSFILLSLHPAPSTLVVTYMNTAYLFIIKLCQDKNYIPLLSY